MSIKYYITHKCTFIFLERKKILEKLNWIIDSTVNLWTPQTKFAVFKVILKLKSSGLVLETIMTPRRQPLSRVCMWDEGLLDFTRGISLGLCQKVALKVGIRSRNSFFFSNFSQEAVQLGRWTAIWCHVWKDGITRAWGTLHHTEPSSVR